ncbi:MAG TPA: UDP-N-acetylmuramate dehydrogenase [Actinocrinis sp.]|uniref:UDP-N-acetylmuramate dehydrogenase n=1 Tax=Actinocrinis sp. TaxID=1920516 RepID=UPI002DDDB588|nr:UDP-N-acetylmuramate dehydrogenase [Actinocrinis sp.]HEV2344128.1 UDP-N-acetylmuramate dehydrogenase [Actinocrinis sp.]
MTGGFEHAVGLAPYTTLRLGGPADHFFTADSDADLVAAVRDVEGHGDPLLVLGGGSNLVIADDGFRGTVIRIATTGVTIRDGLVSVAAGVPWDDVVAQTVDEGLSGIECLSGIPGLAGATPIQNVGAYGQDVSETVVMVDAYDRVTKSMTLLDNADCGFTYRHSVFKGTVFEGPVHDGTGRYIVTCVHFQLTDAGGLSAPLRYKDLAGALGLPIGERAPLKAVREAVLDQRRRRGMVLDPADHDTWSAGSFFTNPVLAPDDFAALEGRCAVLVKNGPPPRFPESDGRIKTSAAWLIEHAGFTKGYGSGPATLSTKHTLALTNRGGATTGDLLRLAAEVRDGVAERFGVRLVPEPVLVGGLT